MKKTVGTRILVFSVSLLFFLGILEIGLRIGGYLYLKRLVNYSAGAATANENAHTILTIGDSFTVGGDGNWEDNYPSQLQRMLSKDNPEQYTVINGGICESNSSQTLWYLKGLIDKYDVDTVVLLVGAANRFNLVGFSEEKTESFVNGLRIGKMARIFWINLKARLAQSQVKTPINGVIDESVNAEGEIELEEPEDCKAIERRIQHGKGNTAETMQHYFHLGECLIDSRDYERAERLYQILIQNHHDIEFAYAGLRRVYDELERYDEAERILRIAIRQHKEQVWPYLELAKHYEFQQRDEEALDVYNQALEVKQHSGLVYKAIGDHFMRKRDEVRALVAYEMALKHIGDVHLHDRVMGIMFRQGQYDKVIQYALKNIELDPDNFDNYYPLVKAYEFQNRYSARDINHFLKDIAKRHPQLNNDATFRQYLELFGDKESMHTKIMAWLTKDYEQILKLCRDNNIRLIIQNYPYPYDYVNKHIAEFADQNEIPFVDQRKVFEGLGQPEKYFIDSDHCTVEGHRVMAQNVKSKILEMIKE